jgi:hypothetical protein
MRRDHVLRAGGIGEDERKAYKSGASQNGILFRSGRELTASAINAQEHRGSPGEEKKDRA